MNFTEALVLTVLNNLAENGSSIKTEDVLSKNYWNKENSLNFLIELTKICRKLEVQPPYYKVFSWGGDTYAVSFSYRDKGFGVQLPSHFEDEKGMREMIECFFD